MCKKSVSNSLVHTLACCLKTQYTQALTCKTCLDNEHRAKVCRNVLYTRAAGALLATRGGGDEAEISAATKTCLPAKSFHCPALVPHACHHCQLQDMLAIRQALSVVYLETIGHEP